MIKSKKFWTALIFFSVVTAAGYKLYFKKDPPPLYQDVSVQRRDIRLQILTTGVVRPQNRLEIKPPISGRAETILAREGDRVRRGQILAWMSSTERAALLDAARARGPEELARWEDMIKPAPLIAPLDGVIISRNVEPGQTLSAQDSVLVMSDRLIVNAQVDETDIARVFIGQDASLVLDAFAFESVEGTVDHIAFEAVTINNVTIYEVHVLPRRVPPFMRSGMTANVTFLIEEKTDVLSVPVEAIREEKGKSWVRWLDLSTPSAPAKEGVVQTGLSDGRFVEIREGLKEGDKILVPVFSLPRSTNAGSSPFLPGGGSGRSGQRRAS